MLTWHPLGTDGLQAHHQGLIIHVQPITDESGRVCLHVASTAHRASAGWILPSVDIALAQAQRLIDRQAVDQRTR